MYFDVVFMCSVTNSGLSKFSIDPNTGEIFLAGALNYEVATSYVITVVAVDGGTPTPNSVRRPAI